MNNFRYKYPRTYHFPFSPGATSDDKVLESTKHFDGKMIVITEKMDGENTTIYRNYYHARSIDSKHMEYHSWLLDYIRQFQYQIPEKWRICGEYLFVKHSIEYVNLKSYFLAFSIWDETNRCLSWDETKLYIEMFGIYHVPELYVGLYDEDKIKEIAKDVVIKGGEGIVVRNKDSFLYDDFNTNIAKYVRENHVQTDKHWSKSKITTNTLVKGGVKL